jgi:hypothetical protein
MDMFEPQDHPNDFAYPGGPPRPPYDNAGWTLAMQMGVQYDRVLDGFECPCEKIAGMAVPPAGIIAGTGSRGLLLSHDANDAFIAVNRALKAGAAVHWLKAPMTAGGKTYAPGSFYIEAAGAARGVADQTAKGLGLSFDATNDAPSAGAVKLTAQRVGCGISTAARCPRVTRAGCSSSSSSRSRSSSRPNSTPGISARSLT